MAHGWPGSVDELLETIGPLTDPTAYGGRAKDAFHLVLPSIPGYGFSDEPTELGCGPVRIGRAWKTLVPPARLQCRSRFPSASPHSFPGEIWRTPRSWVEKAYPNVTYFNEVDKGGHFAAWEEPELFSEDLRAAFRPLR